METLDDSISVRTARLNARIIGRRPRPQTAAVSACFDRETLLDAFETLYAECRRLDAQRRPNDSDAPVIGRFVRKHQAGVEEMQRLRVSTADFHLIALIGRGHFGDVHLVEQRHTGDLYAMKTVRKAALVHTASPTTIERDVMACTVQSQWLTALHYAFQDSAYLYYVMDYHPGGDLRHLLEMNDGCLTESSAIFYLTEIFAALDALHRIGYVHRDVKPENILLDRCGHLKLADFGSAAILDANGKVCDGPPVGTPDYIAPEVLAMLEGGGHTKNYGVSCDFWSLGVIGYELTCGRRPFEAPTTSAIYMQIMNNTHLTFPDDVTVTHTYIRFVRALVAPVERRMSNKQIREHALFVDVDFENIRERVPPHVPKITSSTDVANFSAIAPKQREPSIEDFKKRSGFSTKNFDYIGFTYLPEMASDMSSYDNKEKREDTKLLKKEMEEARRRIVELESETHRGRTLESQLNECRVKLESVEAVREKLEREVATSIVECNALKRALDHERQERADIFTRALDLIRSVKQKWEGRENETNHKHQIELQRYLAQINELAESNRMLEERLAKFQKNDEDMRMRTIADVEKLNRRSVVGLETRLVNLADESKRTVDELRRRLDTTIDERKRLVDERDVALNTGKKLEKQLVETANDYSELKMKIDQYEQIISVLKGKVDQLEQEIDNQEKSRIEINGLESKIDEHKKQMKEITNENARMKLDINRMEEMQKELEKLRKTQEESEKIMDEMKKKLEQTKTELEKKSQSAPTPPTPPSNDQQELRHLHLKVWKMQKELNDAQIDKRIAERENKDAIVEIKELKQTIKNFETKMEETQKNHEIALLEMNKMNEQLVEDAHKMQETCTRLRIQLDEERNKNETNCQRILDLKENVRTAEKRWQDSENTNKKTINDYKNLEKRLEEMREEKLKMALEIERGDNERRQMALEIASLTQQTADGAANSAALREACELLEGQVLAFEKDNVALRRDNSVLKRQIDDLVADVCRVRKDLMDEKRKIDEEKLTITKLEVEKNNTRDDLNELQEKCKDYERHLSDARKEIGELHDKLANSDEHVANLQTTITQYERQMADRKKEGVALKEELSRYITQLANYKEANYKSQKHTDELGKENEHLARRLVEIETLMAEKTNEHKRLATKNDETIKQQIKLIDYLQTKLDDQSQRKKMTLADKIFGHAKKENQPPPPAGGVPTQQIRELQRELQKEREKNRALLAKLKSENPPKNSDNIKCAGDVKLAIDGGWRQCNARLTENSLQFIDGAKMIFEMNFNDRNGQIILEPLPSEIAPMECAKNDLTLVLKVDHRVEGALRSLVFMTPSVDERDRWYGALRMLFSMTDDRIEMLCKIDSNLKINEICDLSDGIMALATDRGLYTHSEQINHVEAFDVVHKMIIVPAISHCIFIANQSRHLAFCETSHLLNLAQCHLTTIQPQLRYRQIEGVTDALMVGASRDARLFAVATRTRLALIAHDGNAYIIVRWLDTAAPSAAVLFTPHSLLVAADRVYEVDLRTYTAEEFVDASDAILRPVTKCHKLHSYPMAIYLIKHDPREYLLCFKEFAVFVDEYGRASREHPFIESTYCPIVYHYVPPLLYIVQHTGIEIIRLADETTGDKSSTNQSVRVRLRGMRVVGARKRGRDSGRGVYTQDEDAIRLVDGRRFFDGDVNDDETEDGESEENFSFTSSMVQSLEGDESGGDERKVTFAHVTDL